MTKASPRISLAEIATVFLKHEGHCIFDWRPPLPSFGSRFE